MNKVYLVILIFTLGHIDNSSARWFDDDYILYSKRNPKSINEFKSQISIFKQRYHQTDNFDKKQKIEELFKEYLTTCKEYDPKDAPYYEEYSRLTNLKLYCNLFAQQIIADFYNYQKESRPDDKTIEPID